MFWMKLYGPVILTLREFFILPFVCHIAIMAFFIALISRLIRG